MGVGEAHVGSYVGGYRIKALLGEGRLGLVFRARAQDEATAQAQGGDVIFRAIREQLCERTEFRASFNLLLPIVATLDHPGIVRHIDALELPDGQLALIEEFVEGTPIDHLMGHGAPMPWSRALTIIQPMLGAMAHAQARQMVHGAINPTNVLIRTHDEQVMLLDYGVEAAELGPGLAYMAPELLPIGPRALLMAVRAASPPSEQSDIYSVGLLLYVMLTGNFPWGGTTRPREIVEAKLDGDFPRVDDLNPTVPPALASVVAAAMDLDLERRVRSVVELSRALTQAVEPAIGQWVGPGKTITREKQFVAQRLEEALSRRNEPRTRSSASIRAIEAVSVSSHEIEAIHTGDANPVEVARIAHARENWAKRANRGAARAWAYAISALSGPILMAILGLLIAAGVRIPVPEDWLVFVGPAVLFYFLGASLGLKSGLRDRRAVDFSVVPRAIVSPFVSIAVLFGGGWLLDVTNLGGSLDAGPQTAVMLAAIWSANALIGCWVADRLNKVVDVIDVEDRLPPSARHTGRHRVV
ncbi:MAG: serine/threonine protein kinase [Deltaproteobacteria bacterium]|nr:serine/threonine protein kinase [Deltaproteobacteria bacterium]